MRNKPWLQSIAFFLLFQYSTCCENLTCFVDYVHTLSCILRHDLGARSYNLTATWVPEEEPENTVAACSLLQLSENSSHTQYMCTVDMTGLLADTKVQVDVTEVADRQHVISKGFYMAENIKPQPPFNLTAVFSEGYNISWKTIYQDSSFYFLNEELEYQLRYKRRTDTWETRKMKAVHEDKQTLMILPWELQANTEYEFQVRARPREDTGYCGFWSEWSSSLTLKTSPAAVTQTAGMGWLLLFGVVVAITASVTTFLAKQRRHSYGPARAHRVWSPAGASPRALFCGALLPFSWLGRDNGTWGLRRGHPAPWAVLPVLSVLDSYRWEP